MFNEIWRKTKKYYLTFVIASHISSKGFGSGSGFLATLSESKWHILSYDNMTLLHLSLGMLSTTRSSHTSKMVNTCEHDSELKVEQPMIVLHMPQH